MWKDGHSHVKEDKKPRNNWAWGWKDSQKNDEAVSAMTNGCSYDGDWKANKMHGFGTLQWQDGSKYCGQF